jgi:hypothetical protein
MWPQTALGAPGMLSWELSCCTSYRDALNAWLCWSVAERERAHTRILHEEGGKGARSTVLFAIAYGTFQGYQGTFQR